jgi:hypothetical protein
LGTKSSLKIKSKEVKKVDVMVGDKRIPLTSKPNGIFEGTMQIQSDSISVQVSEGGSTIYTCFVYKLN